MDSKYGGMKPDKARDWQWADGHNGALADIIRANAGPILSVKTAEPWQDMKRATDLIVTVPAGEIALRVRRPRYRDKWRDLTIRSWRKNGSKTELAKIKEGHGKWYLYAWSDGNGGLQDWMFIDLDRLRQSGLLENRPEKCNKGGTTKFIAISSKELRECDCIVAEK